MVDGGGLCCGGHGGGGGGGDIGDIGDFGKKYDQANKL